MFRNLTAHLKDTDTDAVLATSYAYDMIECHVEPAFKLNM